MGDLTRHMVEHLVLVGVIAPVVGWFGRRRTGLVAGTVASSIALVVWHVPVLFDMADRTPLLHGVEHLSFLMTALLLWRAVWRSDNGAGVLALFAASLPATFLGATLTLSAHPWYAAYPSLADQRIAGALMWAAGSVTGLAAAAVAFARWLYAGRRALVADTTPSPM